MSDLKTITSIVKYFLEEDKRTREDDNYLYLNVVSAIGFRKGIYVGDLSFNRFMLNMYTMGFPPFESVRRARQKLQAKYPELRACEAVENGRALNEEAYREYARSEV